MNNCECLQVACDIKVVVNETLIYASILTIVAFTIERFLINNPVSKSFSQSIISDTKQSVIPSH